MSDAYSAQRVRFGTLFVNQRVGLGSTIQTRDIRVADNRVKTFSFFNSAGTSRVGSWYIDVDAFPSIRGGGTFYKYAAGTFRSPGSVKSVSFTEAFFRARARIATRTGERGSVNILYTSHSEAGVI